MKVRNFTIPIYDYKVTLITIEDPTDADACAKYLAKFKCQKEDVEDVLFAIKNKCVNGGNIFRNLDMKRFLVVVYPCTSRDVLANILAHEKKYIEVRLLEHVNTDDIEALTYLLFVGIFSSAFFQRL